MYIIATKMRLGLQRRNVSSQRCGVIPQARSSIPSIHRRCFSTSLDRPLKSSNFKCVIPHALGDGSSGGVEPNNNASTADAFSVAEECMRLFKIGETASIISYLPDAVIDNALERKRSKISDMGAIQQVTDADLTLVELLELSPPIEFSADAFAMRGLVLAPPASYQPLSTLRVGLGRCLQRYSVTTQSGEAMTVVFDLLLEEAVEPRYRGFKVVDKWFIKGLTGEAADLELPSTPDPCHGPEAIISAQLAALKAEDAREVFKFASKRNKSAFDNSIERFSVMLGSEGFAPLLGHTTAEVLRSTQMASGRNFAVVGVTDASKSRWLYGWALALEEQERENGDKVSCWVTEAVYPLPLEQSGFFAL